ncbi:DUF2345 domain-containing protein, partial [Burkholderia sp. Bp9031]|uniref:DUF2345 domain-containing protein n=1 Tax=Burkholderia sp. Bp9031 TaxID=2184566 RepID=UPI000FAB1BAA
AAERSAHIASGEDVAVTSGRHVGIAVGRSLFASVSNAFSLFVHKAGMALVAAAGKVRIEARTDGIDVTAKKAIRITSTADSIHLHAAEEIVLHAGSTEVRISDQGYVVRTAGEHTIFAGSHQTDEAQVRPMRLPVTPDNPGQYAAHFVLLEHDSGFALPNQPYRITLDNGRVIEGVSNELGETDVVTSHDIAFGTVELLAASDPDKVIAVNRAAIVRDNTTPYTARAPNADKRTTTIKGKKVSTPEQGATSASQPAAFASCDPLNFGLRFHHFIDGAKHGDTPPDMPVRRDVEYPVTKAYAAAIKKALTGIEWGKFNTLSGEISDEAKESIALAVGNVLNTALAAGPFGLPRGSSGDRMRSNAATPTIDIVNATEGAARYNMRPDVSASFVGRYWVIAIQEREVAKIVTSSNNATALDGTLKAFADLLYHEARHCQQTFWMMALLQQHPSDYVIFSQAIKVYKADSPKEIFEVSEKAKIPDDVRVAAGLHRMLVFHYYWMISYMQNQTGGAYVKPDVPIAQAEVCKLLRVSPEMATKMVNFEDGYRSQLHEEDAYACAEVVQAYWDRPDRAFVRNPGTCTGGYDASLQAIGGGI